MSKNNSKARRLQRQQEALNRRFMDRNFWKKGEHPSVETRNPDEKLRIADQDIANLTAKGVL